MRIRKLAKAIASGLFTPDGLLIRKGDGRQSGSAYSVEEHMFNQDEIQKRHPATDQQRSEKPELFGAQAFPHDGRLDQQRSEAVIPSDEWVINQLRVIERFQSRVEGDQNPSAVALRRAIEIITQLTAVTREC